jgi:hypothetical protein
MATRDKCASSRAVRQMARLIPPRCLPFSPERIWLSRLASPQLVLHAVGKFSETADSFGGVGGGDALASAAAVSAAAVSRSCFTFRSIRRSCNRYPTNTSRTNQVIVIARVARPRALRFVRRESARARCAKSRASKRVSVRLAARSQRYTHAPCHIESSRKSTLRLISEIKRRKWRI